MRLALPRRRLLSLALALALALPAVFARPALAGPQVVEVKGRETGVAAYFVEERSNPIFTLVLDFPGGSGLDPEGREGLARMTAALLDEGAGDLDTAAFRAAIEDRAIELQISAGRESTQVQLRTLTRHRDKALELLRLALSRPRFDAEPVERVRGQLLASLRAQSEDPEAIAGKLWMQEALAGHPYGRPDGGSPKTIRAITVADLQAFTARQFQRGGVSAAAVGDVSAAELATILDTLFAPLSVGTPMNEVAARPVGGGRMLVVEKDVPQTVVAFGQTGIERKDQDWYAAFVLTHILAGGGFTSRLTEEVREKRGLTYGISASLVPYEGTPLLYGQVATKNASVAETIAIIRREWQRIVAEGVTAQELADAKTYLTGSFPLNLTSTRRLAGTLASMQRYGLGLDHIDRRPKLIEAVSAADVQRVARRLLDDATLLFVMVGRPEGVAAQKVTLPAEG